MSMSAQEELRLALFDLARAKLVEAHKLMDEACDLENIKLTKFVKLI